MDSIEHILETSFTDGREDAGAQAARSVLGQLVAPAVVKAYAFYGPTGGLLHYMGDLSALSDPAPTGDGRMSSKTLVLLTVDVPDLAGVTGSFVALLQYPAKPPAEPATMEDLKSFLAHWYQSLLQQEHSAELEARLKLVVSERDVLEREQRHVLAMNLAEREARLEEHRAYAARLEEEVYARTQQLRQRNAELERARAEIEQHLQTARLQTHECEAAMRRAEEANSSKTRFLANMSHEVRTPLTAILGFTDVIDELCHDDSNEEIRQNLQVIRRNGEHLLGVINDILDISRIESGRLECERSVCQPPKVVQEVVDSLKEIAAAKGISLTASAVGTVPEQIMTDPVRLRQILINLVGNAIKFTPEGGVEVRYHLSDLHLGPPTLEFEVSDTGIGVPEEKLQAIFEPFVQADSSTRRDFGGAGLGLTISQRLARMLGGDVVARSNPDRGATFTASVSLGEAKPPPVLPTSVLSESIDSLLQRLHARKWKALLVEDSADNQRLITYHLKKCGAEVEVAANGAQGVEAALDASANGKAYDVIFMDMQMPVMDGYEAVAELRKQGYSGWVIALTAHAMKGDRQKCLQAGCDDYATKPIDRDAFVRQVARCVLATKM